MLLGLVQNLRQRVSAAIGVVAFAVCLLAFGALMAFYISPSQALEWRRIQGLPELDAPGFAATATGQEVAITGWLDGNERLTPEGFVAYEKEKWVVKPPSESDEDGGEPTGSWELIEQAVPALTISLTGGAVRTLPAGGDGSHVEFGGNLHKVIQPGEGPLVAEDAGEPLPDGTLRIRGLADGDLVTVVGQKGSTGDLIPDRLFGGDRVQLVESIRQGAKAAFLIGIGMMICSPLVLVGGGLAVLFGRRR